MSCHFAVDCCQWRHTPPIFTRSRSEFKCEQTEARKWDGRGGVGRANVSGEFDNRRRFGVFPDIFCSLKNDTIQSSDSINNFNRLLSTYLRFTSYMNEKRNNKPRKRLIFASRSRTGKKPNINNRCKRCNSKRSCVVKFEER